MLQAGGWVGGWEGGRGGGKVQQGAGPRRHGSGAAAAAEFNGLLTPGQPALARPLPSAVPLRRL